MQILPARSAEMARFVADVTRMRAVLDLEPPSDPLAGLAAMWGAVRRSRDESGTATDGIGLDVGESSAFEQ